MKNVFFTAILSLLLFGCSGSAPTVSEQPVGNTENTQQPETVAAHTLDKEQDAKAMPTADNTNGQTVEKSDNPTKWTRSGDPIDVSEFNAEIAKAEKDLKADPSDETLKKNLSAAYTKRGVALTEARQYASAIGDYRKAIKYDAANEEAKKWIATIANIYKSMKREIPPEGEEPEPLEFKKERT